MFELLHHGGIVGGLSDLSTHVSCIFLCIVALSLGFVRGKGIILCF
jgi:hypothetical protein